MAKLLALSTLAIVTCAATVLVGCRVSSPRFDETARVSPADCPDQLSDQVRVAASAAAISLPEGLSFRSGTKPEELVARRLLISASPARGAAGARVLGSSLTITIAGGTFAGSIRAADARNRALEVIPGRLRVEPFLGSSKLRAETVALDVALVPGGVPADKMTVALPPLWTSERHPIPPDTLQIAVSAERHLTAFDVVEAHVHLQVDATGPGRSRDIWRCSYESSFTLVDRDSVLPALWDLRIDTQGKQKRWLALFEPAVGPFRAIFGNAEAAQAFATWLHATGATRVGPYQLGLFQADAIRHQSTLPADLNIASTFQPLQADEVQKLTVGRLGEY